MARISQLLEISGATRSNRWSSSTRRLRGNGIEVRETPLFPSLKELVKITNLYLNGKSGQTVKVRKSG